jgi:hypothetical protein
MPAAIAIFVVAPFVIPLCGNVCFGKCLRKVGVAKQLMAARQHGASLTSFFDCKQQTAKRRYRGGRTAEKRLISNFLSHFLRRSRFRFCLFFSLLAFLACLNCMSLFFFQCLPLLRCTSRVRVSQRNGLHSRALEAESLGTWIGINRLWRNCSWETGQGKEESGEDGGR